MELTKLIDELIAREGGYSNRGADKGGETNYGVTMAVARANGYIGDMRALPRELAASIYTRQYWTDPGFDKLAVVCEPVAAELFDTGVNCGVGFAKPLIQRALNLLNRQGQDYPDITVDGVIGSSTVSALRSFLGKRGKPGEAILVRVLNIMQGTR